MPRRTEQVVIPSGEGKELSGALSLPEGQIRRGVILAHGAGNHSFNVPKALGAAPHEIYERMLNKVLERLDR